MEHGGFFELVARNEPSDVLSIGGRGGGKEDEQRRLLLFRARLVFSFGDIQELLNVQNSLGTRQPPLSGGNETSVEGLLRAGATLQPAGVPLSLPPPPLSSFRSLIGIS